MSNKKHSEAEATPETQAGKQTAKTDTAENTDAKTAKKAETSPLQDEVNRLTAELLQSKTDAESAKAALAEQNDKYLRVVAEYDNFRKRSQKEREGIYTAAYADVIGQLLPVIDNLDRAGEFADAAKVAEGVQMICRNFRDVMTKLGITEIEADGKPFDPNLHNAVMHIEDESVGENTVVQVLQKGYRLGDTVLRCAMVKVAN